MKIVQVHSYYRSASPSGENRVVEMQAQALSNAGHEVVPVTIRTDNENGNPLFALQSGFRVALNRGDSPLSRVLSASPDIVHIHNLFPNWSSSWLSDIGLPTVATFHNYRSYCAAGTFSRRGLECFQCPSKGSHNAVLHRCYRNSVVASIPLALATRKSANPRVLSSVDAGVFLSERSRALFEKLGPIPPLSAVIPNFTEESLKFELRGTGKTDRNGWVFVGRLSSEKGILPLLEHWPVGERLTIVGAGPLERNCRLAARGKNVSFVGLRSPNEVRSYIASAEGLIFPSFQESAPALVYIDALAEGTPTIALNIQPVSDDVREHQTGEVAQTFEEVPYFLKAIRRDWTRYHQKARQRFQERYSVERWTNEIERLYKLVAERKRPSPI